MLLTRRTIHIDLRKIGQAAEALRHVEGKVGWFEKSKYPDGTPVALVAYIQEKGYLPKNIPPRPFLRPTAINNEEDWQKLSAQIAQQVIANKMTAKDGMQLLVDRAAGQVKKTISNVWQPALKEQTILRRLSKRKNKKVTLSLTKPLIDTGIMFGTCIGVVEDI